MSIGSRSAEFWPPVKRQKFASVPGELKLCSNESLTFSFSDAELSSLLLISGFRSMVENLGFQIALSPPEQAKIRIAWEISMAKQSYEIHVDSSNIAVVAGDKVGILYALYTIQQSMQLFSNVDSADGVTSIGLPCGSIVDRPDVETRAVILSHAEATSADVSALIFFLSKLRINEIQVQLDFESSLSCDFDVLLHQCSSFFINVVPVVTFSNTCASFSVDALRPFIPFSGRSVVLLLTQNHSGVDKAAAEAAAALAFLQGIASVGYGFVVVSGSQWALECIKPSTLAEQAQLKPVDRELSVAHPTSLNTRCVVCVQDYVQAISQMPSNGVFLSFPATDLKLPALLRKVGCLLFAGVAWNKNYVCETLGVATAHMRTSVIARPTQASGGANSRVSFDLSPFKRVIQSLLLPVNGSVAAHVETTLAGLFCGEAVNFEIQTAVANQPVDLRSEHSLTLSGVIRAEKLLWALLNAKGLIEAPENIPSKFEVSLCLKIYSNLLTQCQWEQHKSKQHTAESSEVFSTINLLASLCKAIIWMHNAWHATSMEQQAAINNDLQNMHQKRAAVYDNVDTSKPYIAKEYPKSDEIRELLTYVVQQNILFRNYQAEEHVSIVKAFECINTQAGDIVIKQGDSGEYFYIIESGAVDVFMECSGLKIKIGQTLKRGKYFGELALMYNTPRAATVISTEDCVLWRIDRQTYRQIVTHHNKETSAEFASLISNVYILGKRLGDVLSQNELNKVVSSLEIEEFENDSVIVRQYLTGDYFYIITEGVVDVWQEDPESGNSSLMGKKVATLSRGNYFGEKALLADDVRQASCVAVGKVTCLSLSREDFIAMFGSLQDITGGGLRASADHTASGSGGKNKLSIQLTDLQTISVLGVGAFGKVKMAKHKLTQQTFAVKFQSKAFICSQNMQSMIESEARIMSMIDHPCIAKLYAAMQDSKFIYFILELLPGGEFFSYLQTAGKLTEDKARFYSAAVVCAFEEMHRQKIAYRDLKPENMVLDKNGYVKLVDLGLAKQILSGSTWTMCGTPDYLAPELVLNKGHDYAVDYWALGVLIYEMIHGWPPFFHDNPMKIYEKIISGKVNYPETFSHTLEDIISKLLTKNPSKRLGNMKGGIADVMKHKWYGSFDWKGLLNGTIAPPYVPDLSHVNTTEPLDADDDADDEAEMEESDWVAQF